MQTKSDEKRQKADLILEEILWKWNTHKVNFGVASKGRNEMEYISSAFHCKGERKLLTSGLRKSHKFTTYIPEVLASTKFPTEISDFFFQQIVDTFNAIVEEHEILTNTTFLP